MLSADQLHHYHFVLRSQFSFRYGKEIKQLANFWMILVIQGELGCNLI